MANPHLSGQLRQLDAALSQLVQARDVLAKSGATGAKAQPLALSVSPAYRPASFRPASRRQARWRERQRRDVLVVNGEVPRAIVEALVDLQWLRPEEAGSRAAIHAAMVAALQSIRR